MNQKIGIFIFRRDLRLNDNLGLLKLIHQIGSNTNIIIPIFILDKYQIKITSKNEHYFSNNVVQFMCESLIDLDNQFAVYGSKLRIFYGEPSKIVSTLIKWIITNYQTNPSDIYLSYNCDYSNYAVSRDTSINDIGAKNKINLITCDDDYLLIPFDKIIKSDGDGFKQYGAFLKNALKHSVNKPIKNIFKNYLKSSISTGIKSEYSSPMNKLKQFYTQNDQLVQRGGRKEAEKKLKKIGKFKEYESKRNLLSYNTTNLSAYLNFGCISIREMYLICKKTLGSHATPIIKQLYWRDFYLQAFKYLPGGTNYKHMDLRYEKIKWKNSSKDWDLLLNSKTGFLIVDAAIQEMKITGFMHGRARMIVGVFWTKYLLINIFHEKYGSQVGYSHHLVDAIGPTQNKMNHQWITEFDYPGKKYAPREAPIAGRPMNPSNKMIAKFDPGCIYIKKWLPHLSNVPCKDLYKWNTNIANKYNQIHPEPMFDYKVKYQEWINVCKHACK